MPFKSAKSNSAIKRHMYQHGHVFRTMGFAIQFAFIHTTRISIIESAPPQFTPDGNDFAGFFTNTHGREYPQALLIYDSVKERFSSLRDNPATANEFTPAQVHSCETVGHIFRCNACFKENENERNALFKKSISIYEEAVLSMAFDVFIIPMKRITQHTSAPPVGTRPS